jgi:hypothetical protein
MTASASQSFAKAQLAVWAPATTSGAYVRWQQLLVEEQALQAIEALMCVCNIRWSSAFWQALHDRSEQLSHDMAACLKQLEASR